MAKGQMNAAFKAQLIIPEHRQLYEYWLLKAAGRPIRVPAEVVAPFMGSG